MAGRDADLRARLLATFQVEAAEHLAALRAHLIELSGRELVETTFRELHTLKGAARSVGRRDVERVCAAAEALLSAHSRAGTVPSEDVVALLEEAVAAVAALLAGDPAPPALVERLQREATAASSPPAAPSPAAASSPPAAAPPRAAAPPPLAPASPPVAAPPPPTAPAALATPPAPTPRADTIRVATEDLDELLRRGEELLALKLTADAWVARADALQQRLRHSAAEPEARALANGLRHDRRVLATAVDGLLEQARRVRMMPASSALDVLGPMARDLARAQGKRVRWSAAGGDVLADRRVLEAIKDPLLHMVRNAVDHGLEPPAERAAAGKPDTGTIAVSVELREGGRLEIALTDDGRGIDAERVRAAAPHAEDPLAAVFRSGVSTSAAITDVSGHGLGLAIVKEQVERLGGTVVLESRPRAGTTVRLTVPQTIATFRGLLVSAGGQRFLLPLDAVERVTAAGEADRLPRAELAALLGLEPGTGEWRACAIVTAGAERAGLIVDDVLGDREVLVKELEPPLIRVRHVAAAGLLGAGELVLVLRPADLLAAIGAAPEPPWVLVVDDAATTRAMERGLLELAGYRVRVAEDGEEAWAALKNGRFDLVISDVDMPRLNGVQLTERIRADDALADLPVVLVSALDDERRGLDAGANAYVVKSSLEQTDLLEIIRRLGVG
ncbi:MAG TPA: response regulator [Solirubrobacter sp.]|nr:response regulator [Solirubrobacter sp.]